MIKIYLHIWVENLHALSCTCKAICTWNTQKAVQECREACGGHGYLYGKIKTIEYLIENQDRRNEYHRNRDHQYKHPNFL